MSESRSERGKLSAFECFVVFALQILLLVILDPKVFRASELIGASAFFLVSTALHNVAPQVKALERLRQASRLVFLGFWIWFVGFLVANGAPGWFWGRYLLGMAPTLYAVWHTRQRHDARKSENPSGL